MAERNLDFDTVIDRRNSNSIKYDFAKRKMMPEDLQPMWIADMDFRTSSYILDALLEEAKYGKFSHREDPERHFEIIQNWMKRHYDWEVSSQWLVQTPGIVYVMGMAIQAFTKEGDGVLIQLPVYYPFFQVIEANHRKVISNTLVQGEDGRYCIDFDDFENKIVSEKIKLFFLCNPHNPVGRVWTEEELMQIGDICYRNHVLVISDEIHADFVFHGKHLVFANLDERFAKITITCTSPAKTFNMAGLQIANIFIADQKIKEAILRQIEASGYDQPNVMGLVACEAAYRDGEEWYQAVFSYIKANIEYCREFIKKEIPEITMTELEGTYLVWLDFRRLNLSDKELERLIIREARLWLDSGKMFGECGSGFQRINVACPHSILTKSLNQLAEAVALYR